MLRDFFEGTRLKEIPASRKKRAVILRWLANQFEPEIKFLMAALLALRLLLFLIPPDLDDSMAKRYDVCSGAILLFDAKGKRA